jgi:glutaredoxin 3
MARVQIYSKKSCPFCVRAKALLDRKGVPYEEIDARWAASPISTPSTSRGSSIPCCAARAEAFRARRR